MTSIETDLANKEIPTLEEDLDDEYVVVAKKRSLNDERSRNCPYLDTINRSVLDFDFEKLCSISLSHLNVYACMVCGKYFQGRGIHSHAYTHSVQDGHHVFLNLDSKQFYCLPDNYKIIDQSLEDIVFVLDPYFTEENVKTIDESDRVQRANDGSNYLPGIVGLNNIKSNDYCNVILQALAHVQPIRDYFLRSENYLANAKPGSNNSLLLAKRFGELVRKLWNPKNFKAHVSPHEMLQAVVLCSKKKFQITKQGDPIDFVSWFLNALHIALGGTKKTSSSVIHRTFMGKMNVFSRKIPHIDTFINELDPEKKRKLLEMDEYKEVKTSSNFLYLTCDMPPAPLYPDDTQENIIPQVPIFNLLNKFNGTEEKEYKTYKDSTMKRFEITHLPPFIILFIKRFTKNQFALEKNPTIVNFPVREIDFGELMSPECRSRHEKTKYDLIANVVHEGKPGADLGQYMLHVLHKATKKWYRMQDLHVGDILPQMITLSECYIQIYEISNDEFYTAKKKSTT